MAVLSEAGARAHAQDRSSSSTAQRQPKIIVTMPAYNAAKTLLKTFEAMPKGIVSEIILVDDCSHDDTTVIGKSLTEKSRRLQKKGIPGFWQDAPKKDETHD